MAKKILKFALSPIAAVTGLLSKKKKVVETVAKPRTAMPDADGDAVKAARRRSVAAQVRRGGRTSTILTGDSLGA